MKVSIVMSAYNAEKYVKESVMSCMGQSYSDTELIVVEDKSTDCTLDVLEALQQVYGFRIIRHEKNLGAGQSRRDGIEAATGEYVITVDSDDTIDHDFIEKLVKKAEETGADIVSGGITIIRSDDYKEIKCFREKVSTGLQKFKDYDEGKIVFLANKIVRRSLYEKVPYCTRRYCEDTPVIFPLLYWANMVAYADTQGYNYFQRGDSLCHSVNAFEDAMYKALCCKDCIAFFEDKEPEYRGIVTMNQFVDYVRKMKSAMSDDDVEKHKDEFAELMAAFIKAVEL